MPDFETKNKTRIEFKTPDKQDILLVKCNSQNLTLRFHLSN